MNQKIDTTFDNYKYGFRTHIKSLYKIPRGLDKNVIKKISKRKNEPEWMLNYRLKAYEIFKKKPMPTWGPDLSEIDFNDIHYYQQTQKNPKARWQDLPREIKNTFEKLGIPQAEKIHSSGTGAQYESEIIYHTLKKDLEKKGVIFEPTDTALQKHPELFKKYFGKIVPPTDNKFAALNSAVWSGGTFIYIPKNVHIDLPLQAYFRINDENTGQFERTLIIADEGTSIHYIEGCSAPICANYSLHAAVVEIYARKNARVQYTTIQNWAQNIYNLVTKRAYAYKNAEMLFLDCNFGSKVNMKYPAIFLQEEGAKGEIHSFALASKEQIQDTGTKIFHNAKNTSSKIISKSICKDKGNTTFRGLLKINKGAVNSKNHTSCDTLLMDKTSVSNSYPSIKSEESSTSIAHEATTSQISKDQLFYLMSRGLNEEEATSLIVNGFANPIIKKFPMEYAIELNRLLEQELIHTTG